MRSWYFLYKDTEYKKFLEQLILLEEQCIGELLFKGGSTMSELLIICGTLMATINWPVEGLLHMVVQMAIAEKLCT